MPDHTQTPQFRCPKCGKILCVIRFCECGGIGLGIADASQAKTLTEILKVFLRVEQYNTLVGEVILPFNIRRVPLSRIVIGEGGMTRDMLFGTKVRLHSDEVLLLWNEKQL